MKTIITKTGWQKSFYGVTDLARAINRSVPTAWKMCWKWGKIPPPSIKCGGSRLYWSEHEFRGVVAILLEEQKTKASAEV